MYAILYLGLGIICEVIGALLIHKKKEFGIGLCCTGVFMVIDPIFLSLSNTIASSEVVFYFTLAVELAVALVLLYFLIKIGFQKIGETSNQIFEAWGLFLIPLMNLFYVFFATWMVDMAITDDFSTYFASIMEVEKNDIIVFLLLYGVGTGIIWIGKGVISYGIGGYFCLFGISRGAVVMYRALAGPFSFEFASPAIDCTTYLCFGFLVPTAWRVAHERQEIRKRGKISEWKN